MRLVVVSGMQATTKKEKEIDVDNFRARCRPPPRARVAVSRWFTSSGRSTTTSGAPAPTSWRSTSLW